MLSASRKRLRSDSEMERPAKAARVSWKSSYRLPESSPGLSRHLSTRQNFAPFMSEATIPELSSPTYHGPSDEENDPDLPLHSFHNMSSMVGSSPPRTPPSKVSRLSRTDRPSQHEDGADLLLYLANSPTPARAAGGSHTFPPSTPPSQHAILPHLTPNLGTPGQQFNFADFVNVTPSPAQLGWGGRTPGNPSQTPLATKDARKRLNFDALVPPTSASSPRVRGKDSGLALQLGGELRP